MGGYWSIPCGAIEKGENGFLAAKRELKEETEIDVDASLLQYVTAFKAHDGGRFNLYLYNSSQFLSPVLDYEHTEWGYFKLDALEHVYINEALLSALTFLRDDFLEL
jgi:8-oxo-dGTP pyrophosphatase MutT (NUDIX family)